MRGGTVYILQEFAFHVHCFCCPLYDFFVLFFGGGIFYCHNLNLDNARTGFKRLFFCLTVSHSRFALLKMFSKEFSWAIPRTANREPREITWFCPCLHRSRLQSAIRVFNFKDTVLVVSDLRQHVISRDQSDRSPIWSYQSRYICFGNNFKYQI